MPNIFVISDTHFGHANILSFVNEAGVPLRDFRNVEEMDEHMIQQWNSVVRPQDKVYHLGDVAMHKEHVQTVARCNGHKRLIRGNHDVFVTKWYMRFFEEVYATRILNQMLLSHIPVHPESIGKAIANVHGHVHNNVPALHYGPKYYNVSTEALDYTPISLEDLKRRVEAQQAA